jgi:beta-barrel assembly-enhancing protease
MRCVCLLAILVALRLPAQDAKKDPDQIGTRDVSRGINFFSIEKEMTLGKELSRELERHKTLVTDKQVTEYVNRLGQKLASHSDAKIPLTIKVIEGDDPNAITLPGGFIYVQTGLLRTADTEAELAAAMAHEIGHVAARHGTRQATQAQVTQLATIPLFFLGGWGGICALGASNSVMPLGLLATQRGNEAEADLLGLEYLYKSGYDPLGMVEIFEKIFSFDDQKRGKMAKVFSDHPGSDSRLIAVQKNIETLLKEQPQYIVTTSEFNEVQARLMALDWDRKPAPPAPKAPTLHRPGDQIANSKKLVTQTDARASQIKEAYTVR